MAYKAVSGARFKFAALIDFGGQYIYCENHEDPEINRICSNHMDTTMRRFIIKMAVMVLSLSSAEFGPIYVYIFYEIKTTTVDVRVPSTEEGSDAEFAINFLLMNCIAAHGGLQYVGLEVIMSLFENIVTLAPKLVGYKLRMLANEYANESITELEMRLRFRNVVEQSFDVDK